MRERYYEEENGSRAVFLFVSAHRVKHKRWLLFLIFLFYDSNSLVSDFDIIKSILQKIILKKCM